MVWEAPGSPRSSASLGAGPLHDMTAGGGEEGLQASSPTGRAASRHLLPFRNSIAASAVCAFNLSAISQAFNGPFRSQENPRAAWLPIANPIPNFQVQLFLPVPSPHRPPFPSQAATSWLSAAQHEHQTCPCGSAPICAVCDSSLRGW